MRLLDEGDRPLAINLVPMIDVILSILAFFVLSMLFVVPSEGLDVNLPQATTAASQAQSAFRVGIDASGNLYFEQQAISLEQLVATLQREVTPQQNLVVIQADQQVNHGRVVEVMDQLRQIDGVKLAIATVSPEP